MHTLKKTVRKTVVCLSTAMVFALVTTTVANAQQDPQYTQYMYNTMSVNPAYAGQREVLSVTGLYRNQWVGLDGAPDTQSLGIHSPLGNRQLGLGLSVVNDILGPAQETYLDGNFSYTIPLDRHRTKLSFGLKTGIHNLSTDWSRGRFKDPDNVFNENVSLLRPTVGAGLYLHTRAWYLGFSVPNFLETRHYDDIREVLAAESFHYFLIGGYVFDLDENLKLKPAFLVKGVSGSPIIADISANFIFRNRVTIGAAWRWGDSFAGLAGFQVTEGIYLGYAYDLNTTGLSNYNSGTHEVFIRFEPKKRRRLFTPRCF